MKKIQGTKRYVVPATSPVQIQTASFMLASKVGINRNKDTEEQWTREQKGNFGGKLWEDMQ